MTERDVTDRMLTPDEVREMQGVNRGAIMNRLLRNYLTLWDELEHEREISDKAVKRVTQLEALIPKRLIQRVGGTETG